LKAHYDRLWADSIKILREGRVDLDPVLAARQPDRRRGLTVIAQPSPKIRRAVAKFLGQLQRIEPDQHYYASSEFHVTVLSLFTATVDHEPFLARTAQYRAAVDSALRNASPLQIEFAGITASPAAILVQGFCDDEAINEVRKALRHELTLRGLAEGADGRYRLETAHMTVARFRAPLRDPARWVAALECARQLPFGKCTIGRVRLVRNDWYMTRQVLKTIAGFDLNG
jgi:2'-5' RNA ligase